MQLGLYGALKAGSRYSLYNLLYHAIYMQEPLHVILYVSINFLSKLCFWHFFLWHCLKSFVVQVYFIKVFLKLGRNYWTISFDCRYSTYRIVVCNAVRATKSPEALSPSPIKVSDPHHQAMTPMAPSFITITMFCRAERRQTSPWAPSKNFLSPSLNKSWLQACWNDDWRNRSFQTFRHLQMKHN